MGEARRRKLAGHTAPKTVHNPVAPKRKVVAVTGMGTSMMLTAILAAMALDYPLLPRREG